MLLGLVTSALPACSSTDSGTDAASECKRLYSVECKKFFSCLSADDQKTAVDDIGTSEADCESKMSGDCSTMTRCDTGTHHGDQAEKCVDAFDAFSCDEFLNLGKTTAAPAACDEVCK